MADRTVIVLKTSLLVPIVLVGEGVVGDQSIECA